MSVEPSRVRTVGAVAIIGVLAAGMLLQWWEIAGRIVQLFKLSWLFSAPHPITAGHESFIIFILASLAGAALSAAMRQAARRHGMRVLATVVGSGYVAGVVVWSGMIGSPLVHFAR